MITFELRLSRRRVFEIALLLSVVIHLLLYFVATTFHLPFLNPLTYYHPKHEQQETVATSSSIRIERRPKPVVAQHPVKRSAPPKPVQRPQPQVRPVEPQIARVPVAPVVPKPELPAPVRVKHEIAKVVPRATPEPPKSVPATPIATVAETPPPRKAAPAKTQTQTQKQVALAERALPAQRSDPHRFTQEQIAQIESDLSKTIAQTRKSSQDVLSTVPKEQTDAATKKYSLNFTGIARDLRGAHGLYYPIKEWHSGGWTYYYVAVTIEDPDGGTREAYVPWPIRFRANTDPFVNGIRDVPLPVPLPGWHPDSSAPPMDRALVTYLHQRGYGP